MNDTETKRSDEFFVKDDRPVHLDFGNRSVEHITITNEMKKAAIMCFRSHWMLSLCSILLLIFGGSIFVTLVSADATANQGHLLPVLPSSVSPHYDPSIQIPTTVFMTTKFPIETKIRLSGFFSRNKECNIHILGDDDMDNFMNTKFANTSVLWAYHNINPLLMAAKADIWRMATLWLEGGIYIDADTYIRDPFVKIIRPTDRFVFGSEANTFKDCYDPGYYLNRSNSRSFAEGRIVVNWLFMSAPRHPFLTQALHDMVKTITNAYLKSTPGFFTNNSHKAKFFQIICSTGPGLLTSAMSEVINGHTDLEIVKKSVAELKGVENLRYRYVGEDWKVHGGSWKVPKSEGGVVKYSPHRSYNELMDEGEQLLMHYDH